MTDPTLFGLDPDPERGHREVPMALDNLHGREVTVDDGTTRTPAVVVVDPGLFRMAAWLRREGERMVRTWQRGNLRILSRPLRRGGAAVVQITDEEGTLRLEEIRYPVYTALTDAVKDSGGVEDA